MTAYLQAGDQIHISVPWNLDDKNFEDMQEVLVKAYADRGIEVVMSSQSDHRLPVEIVSVIRPAQATPFEDWLPAATD